MARTLADLDLAIRAADVNLAMAYRNLDFDKATRHSAEIEALLKERAAVNHADG